MEKKRDSLVARLKAGNRGAAAELVDLYYEQIYLLMLRLGHRHHESEDLTQESFIQAWQHIGQLRNSEALKSWIYRIAVNVSKQYWKKHKEQRAAGLEDIEQLGCDGLGRDEVEFSEQLVLLRDAVSGLPVKFRSAIILHYMQHLTIAEAAETEGVMVGTFKSRLSRALKKLRKEL